MKAKRTIAGVVALAVLASSVASMTALAASTVTLSASTDTVEAGDDFSIDVSLSDIPSTKINVLDFAVTYDSSVLTVSDVTIGDSADTDTSGDSTADDAPVFSYSIHEDEGEIAISWTTGLSNDAWISEDGVIFTITGTVSDDAEDGEYPIEFAAISRETYEGSGEDNEDIVIGYIDGSDYATYTVETEAGAVIVGASDVETEPEEEDEDPFSPTEETEEDDFDGLYGDVNVDGTVNLADSVLLAQYLSDVADVTDQGVDNGDVDKSGTTDATDASYLLQYQVGTIDTLPVG